MAATAHGTLVASTPTTVTLDAPIRGFRVTHRGAAGTADLWYTWGYNSAPTASAAGAGTYNLAAGMVDTEPDASKKAARFGSGIATTAFSLFSTGAIDYSVETW